MSGFGFFLYLVFMCSWFLHLPARVPAMAAVRADLLLVCVILFLVLRSDNKGPEPADLRTRNLLYLLVGYAFLSIPLVEWPGSVVRIGFPNFFKAFVFYLFTARLVTTPKRLTVLLVVFLFCQSFRVFEPLYLHVTEGYWGSKASMQGGWDQMNRLSGAPDDTINPNGLASIVVTVVPLLHYLTEGAVFGRILYTAALPGLLWALILTASRSGMVGLGAIGGLIWLKSRHKVLLTVMIVAGVWFALPLLDDNLADRYKSLFSSETKNAATADERVDGMKINFQVAMVHPLFGFGLGTSEEANWNFGGLDLPAHNLYLEVLQELGGCGFILYMMFIGSLIFGLRRAAVAVKQATSVPAVVAHLVPALQVFVGMSVLFSFATYGLSQYDWYLTAGLTEVIHRLLVPATAAAPLAAREPLSLASHTMQPVPLHS